jgi:diamine N-acetyltransferase
VLFRSPNQRDIQALSALGVTTFMQNFAHLYSPENLQVFLDDVHSQAAVAIELNNPNRRYRVAEKEGLIGYCKLGLDGSLPLTLPDRRVLEIRQLYLLPAYFGQGIADQLMHWALEFAHSGGYDDVLLSVYSGNARAQKFYQRFSFEHAGEYEFLVGAHADLDYLYRCRLT